MWGDRPLIRDYSRRQWSGMLTGFYLQRWEQFFSALDAALARSVAFDATSFDKELQTWERSWAGRQERYSSKPVGDALEVSRSLWEKYHLALARAFAPDATSLTTGKPATSSSALPGHAASLANDGRARSTESYWATDVSNDSAPWWQVDLETPMAVGRVVVVGYFGDRRSYGYILEPSLCTVP